MSSEPQRRDRDDEGVALAGETVEENLGTEQEESGVTPTQDGADRDDAPGQERAHDPEELKQPGEIGDQGYGLDTDEPAPRP